MAAPTLTLAALNRATLARQLLLDRVEVAPLEAIERLAGLQAQVARPPFLGLWTRLAGFRREDLIRLAHARKVVRATMMRGTLHLVSARDYAALRPVLQPCLDGALVYAKGALDGFDLETMLRAAREMLEERPRPFEEIRPALVERFQANDRAMGLAVRMCLPLVQLPSDAAWGWDGKAAFAVAEHWLGRELDGGGGPEALVRRYLAAFGPASVADAGAWSGLKGLRPVFEALRPELAVFRDEAGRELFDLPAAPRPDAEVPATVRFLPEFDNLVLAYDDRGRVIDREHRPRIVSKNLQVAATFLVDGRVAGTWRISVKRKMAALELQPFRALTRPDRKALEAEGLELLRFVEEGAREFAVQVV